MTDYEKVLRKNGILSFTPGGVSMWPIISNREDTVIVESPKGRLKKYDVAFYDRGGDQPVLHRVIKVHENGYDMCGDSHIHIEKNITDAQVFGVMTGYYKGKKYIDCQKNSAYKLIVRFWSFSIFFRRVMMKCLRMIGIKPR